MFGHVWYFVDSVLRIPLWVYGLRLHTFSEVAPYALWLDRTRMQKKAGVVPVFHKFGAIPPTSLVQLL